MKIAYLILAFKLPEQLVRLVRKLSDRDTYFFIHIDKKIKPELFQHFVQLIEPNDNVIFIKRHNSDWGRIGCIEAKLEGINEIKKMGVDFDYLINLSGQDYPIKSNQQIADFLQENYGKSFLNYNPIPYRDHPHLDDLINYWHFYFYKYHLVFPKENMFFSPILSQLWKPIARRIKVRPKLPLGYKPYYGSSYWCFTRELIDYVHAFTRENQSFVRWFSHVQFPDEFFFQTMLMNSPYKNEIIDNNLRYIDFSSKKANPKVLTVDDFPKFTGSGKLFARKFDQNVDNAVLDMIDETIEG